MLCNFAQHHSKVKPGKGGLCLLSFSAAFGSSGTRGGGLLLLLD